MGDERSTNIPTCTRCNGAGDDGAWLTRNGDESDDEGDVYGDDTVGATVGKKTI